MRGLSAILICLILAAAAIASDIYDLDALQIYTTNRPGEIDLGPQYTTNRPGVIALEFVATSAQVQLAWDAVQDSGVVGYFIYWGPTTGAYTNAIFVGNVTNATINGLQRGSTYYFAATTTNNVGLESIYSNEASTTTPQ
jgi:hypothetical protein